MLSWPPESVNTSEVCVFQESFWPWLGCTSGTLDSPICVSELTCQSLLPAIAVQKPALSHVCLMMPQCPDTRKDLLSPCEKGLLISDEGVKGSWSGCTKHAPVAFLHPEVGNVSISKMFIFKLWYQGIWRIWFDFLPCLSCVYVLTIILWRRRRTFKNLYYFLPFFSLNPVWVSFDIRKYCISVLLQWQQSPLHKM